MRKFGLILSLVLLLAIGLLGCSPVRYIYQQPYQGVLTDTNLSLTDSKTYAAGTLTFDDHIVIIGYFVDSQGKLLRELQLGNTYRLIPRDNDWQGYPLYNIEQLQGQ